MSTLVTARLDPSVEIVEEDPGVLRYILPSRQLGRWRFLLVTVAWLALGIGAYNLWQPGRALGIGPVNFWKLEALFSRLAIIFIFIGIPLRWLLDFLYGHVEIVVSDDQLRAVGKFLWWTRTSNFRTRDIKRLQIVALFAVNAEGHLPDTSDDSICTLTVVDADEKRNMIAMGYSRGLLESLSAAIASRWQRAAEVLEVADVDFAEPDAGRPIVVETVGLRQVVKEITSSITAPKLRESFVQPEGSLIRYEILEDRFLMEIPPAGVWTGSAGAFQIGLILLAVCAGFNLLFALADFSIGNALKSFVSMSPFWLAAVGLLVAGWHVGNRHVALGVVGDTFTLLQTSPIFKSRRYDWDLLEIKTVDIGDSGTEINDVAVEELQIVGQKKKLYGILAGHDHDEIVWAATLLRYAVEQHPFPAKLPRSNHSRFQVTPVTECPDNSEEFDAGSAVSPTTPSRRRSSAKALPKEIAGFYSDGIGNLAMVMGKMTLFFCWVPILGLIMVAFTASIGLLLSLISLTLGIARGSKLRRTSMKAAGMCLLGIVLAAASTGVVLWLAKQGVPKP